MMPADAQPNAVDEERSLIATSPFWDRPVP